MVLAGPSCTPGASDSFAEALGNFEVLVLSDVHAVAPRRPHEIVVPVRQGLDEVGVVDAETAPQTGLTPAVRHGDERLLFPYDGVEHRRR